jgi:HK97 family phage portal protein
MALLDRIDAVRGAGATLVRRDEERMGVDQWITDYLMPSYHSFNGQQYPMGLNQTWTGKRIQEIASTLPAYAAALRACPPAFAAQMVRAVVLSQARFTFRNLPHSPTPKRKFGTSALSIVEKPWTNATTGELLSRMEWHAGLAGNAYVARQPNRLRVLRPDWVSVVWGSEYEPDDPIGALDAEVIGYVYRNGGYGMANANTKIRTLLPEEVAHWSPIPDPESPGMGQSWVTAALKDIQADRAATEHKLMFFANGATPNMVVKGIPAMSKEQFDEIVDAMEERHTGVRNAYRTLYLTAGADATVVGADLKQLDFKATQGAGETRIALLGRVPAPLLGISEGLAGSSLNAGNFGMARRMFSDTWVYPSLQDVSAALSTVVDVPSDAELWFDASDIPLLREDAKDAADIELIKANTIRQLVDGGFEPGSAVAAVQGQDMNLLLHTGKTSVQLQAPTETDPSVLDARTIVEMIQKGYLGVPAGVVSADELRNLLNRVGAGLPIPGPKQGDA